MLDKNTCKRYFFVYSVVVDERNCESNLQRRTSKEGQGMVQFVCQVNLTRGQQQKGLIQETNVIATHRKVVSFKLSGVTGLKALKTETERDLSNGEKGNLQTPCRKARHTEVCGEKLEQ